jgi:hypothetical protein
MSEIVNLNKARKAKGRTADKAIAEANRVRFGRTKGEKAAAEADAAKLARHLDQTKREP